MNFNAAIGVRQSGIVVVLAIDDDELRSRTLRALDRIDRRFIPGMDFAAADVVICDHLPEADEPPISPPLLVIGARPTIDEAVRRGYAGGLRPSFGDAKLHAAIEAVMHGLVCMDGGGEAVPTFDDEADAEPPLAELTVREAEVLRQLMTGASNKEIARRLDISVHTAKFHVASIAGKLGASGRTDAVARALRLARSMI